MKNLSIALFSILLSVIALSCNNTPAKESTSTHVHEDGSVHGDHGDESKCEASAQESFKVEEGCGSHNHEEGHECKSGGSCSGEGKCSGDGSCGGSCSGGNDSDKECNHEHNHDHGHDHEHKH